MSLRSDPEAMRRYKREWIARRRADFFADKFCVQCGSTDRLELDHIDPSTKVANSIWSWSTERRLAEIAKCQILCHDCHQDKTFQVDLPSIRGYDPNSHGQPRYRKGCRCDVCRQDHARNNREYRRRVRQREKELLTAA